MDLSEFSIKRMLTARKKVIALLSDFSTRKSDMENPKKVTMPRSEPRDIKCQVSKFGKERCSGVRETE